MTQIAEKMFAWIVYLEKLTVLFPLDISCAWKKGAWECYILLCVQLMYVSDIFRLLKLPNISLESIKKCEILSWIKHNFYFHRFSMLFVSSDPGGPVDEFAIQCWISLLTDKRIFVKHDVCLAPAVQRGICQHWPSQPLTDLGQPDNPTQIS
jgi:hypothetical protein